MAVIMGNDIGYGNLKGKARDTNTGKEVVFVIPSHVGKKAKRAMANSLTRVRKVVDVLVDGKEYQVGEEAPENMVKVIHDNYIETANWQAFKMATIKMVADGLETDTIDMLVSGLPVEQEKDPKLVAQMRESFVGKHEVYPGQFVTVKAAQIISQPMGTLASLISSRKDLMNKNILIIDVGHHTLDWLTIFKQDVREEFSDSYAEGVDQIVKMVIETVSIEHGIKVSHKAVDDAIRSGSFAIPVANEEVKIKQYVYDAVSDQMDNAIESIRNTVADAQNISTLVMTGGGGKLYQKYFAKAFPKHEVISVEKPESANAEGYAVLAEIFAQNAG